MAAASWQSEVDVLSGTTKYLVSPTLGVLEYPNDAEGWAKVLEDASAGNAVGIFQITTAYDFSEQFRPPIAELRRVEP